MMNLIWVFVLVLLALWFLGIATSYTMGGLIHILLVVAVIAVMMRLILGQRGIQAR